MFKFSGSVLAVLMAVSAAFAGEAELPPKSEGALAFEVDVCSFRWQGGEGYEEVTLRFPVAQFKFLRQASGAYVARYRPVLRVLDEAGEVVRQVGAESRLEADSLVVDPQRTFMDMVQVRLPVGRYRGELTLSDLQTGRSGLAAFPIEVPAYAAGRLGMSDLYLASEIYPEGAGRALPFKKGEHLILPNPSRTYRPEMPLLFYFEVYHIGRQAHRVEFQILDAYGHAVWQDRRAFPGYRGEARFAEGVPLRGFLPGTYTLKAEVTAGAERAVSERKFEVTGEGPRPADGFDGTRMAAAQGLLERYGGPAEAAAYGRLDRVDRARFLYGFWLARNPTVARAYYGPLTGYGSHEATGALLRALGLSGRVAKRVDRAYAARLAHPDTVQVREAIEVVKALLEADGGDLLARAALGTVYLEQGALADAEQAFQAAVRRGGVLPEAYNGMGLAKVGRKEWEEAARFFEQALTLRPGWRTARVNLALCRFLSGEDAGQEALAAAVAADPTHPEVPYIRGRIYERQGELDSAAAAYLRQLAVNPAHGRARFDLGRVWLKMERTGAAIRAWRELMAARPDLREACLLPLLEAYQQAGETGAAQGLASEYLRTVDGETRALIEDIRLVASPEEAQAYGALPPEARPAFVRAFWQRRDPTPATPGNERLVEHYRRAFYAMQHFSEGRKAWDRRGEVYIRYGEPAHISRAGDVRYETDPAVVRVKERLLLSIPPEGRQEIAARMGRLRTSMRDVEMRDEVGSIVDIPDFESIDFELNPNRAFFGAGEDISEEGRYFSGVEVSHRDRGLGLEGVVRGYPLFPVDGGTRWEYWIYPDVAGGIEVVFTALSGRGDFDYPDVPRGRVLSNFNIGLWTQRRPDRAVASAVRTQADAYRPRAAPLDFYFDTADFRGEGAKSRLEVYYGVPLAELPDSGRAGGQMERGIALFDSAWTPVLRRVVPLPYGLDPEAELEAGTMVVDQVALSLPPGRYHLGVQVRHPQGRQGAYTRTLEVEPYSGEGLMLSDIELAGEAVEDSTVQEKGGLKVAPMPSRTFRPGQPVVIYYEVYGLRQDAFGQTRYRVDYRLAPGQGRPGVVRVLRALGRLIGIEREEAVTISYEHTGDTAAEYNYLEIDLGESREREYELEVSVTDIKGGARVSKEAVFRVAK